MSPSRVTESAPKLCEAPDSGRKETGTSDVDRDKSQRWCCNWLAACGLVLLYIVVRSLNLDLFVTTDEPFWLGRSANFYRALAQRDFVHTYQMAHPGVLTMWAGTVAYLMTFPDYARDVDVNLRFVYGIEGVLRQLGQDPMRLLIVARFSKILLQAVFFSLSLGLLNRLFGRPVMWLAGALIALDPFLSGMDSLLHVDGLFSIANFSAILALALAARSRPDAMAPWLVAGALAACAWMTRATGLVAVVVVAMVALAQAWSKWRSESHDSLRAVLEAPVFAVMLWVSGAGAVSLLLLPALWVDPFGTMQQVWDWSSNAATEGHERPIFFYGIHSGDPGMMFYPVTLLWRLTPVTLAVTLISMILIPIGYRQGWLGRERVQSLVILASFAVTYVAAMSVGAKKFDRYILPVYPIVAVFGAVGIMLLARWMVTTHLRWNKFALPVLGTIVVAGQMTSLATAIPYRLDYFNPILGGLAKAQNAVQVGWGEGGREVMRFVLDDAEGADVIVQKSSATPILSYFATPNIHFDDFGMGTPAGWYETDYFVVGIQEWQRDLSPSYRLMQEYEPAHVVRIKDVPFFKVYTPRKLPLPEHLRTPTGCSATFGSGLELMQVIGRENTIDLYWLTVADAPGEVEIRVTLSSPDTGSPDLVRSATLRSAGKGLMARATIDDPRGENGPPLDHYVLGIQAVDLATGIHLPVSFNGEAIEDGLFQTHSECFYMRSG